MPFARPSLVDLIARTRADAESRLTGGEPVLPASNIGVLARVLAGAAHGLHGHLEWMARQMLPDTAEAEWLERHASIRGLTRVPATYASGTLDVLGATGTVIPADTRWRRDDGLEVVASAAVTIGAEAQPTVPVTARLPGAAGDLAGGQALTLVSPVPGLRAAAVASAAGLTGGGDAESDEGLRARLLAIIRTPPRGGAAADYLVWAYAAHPAITRAWVAPEEYGPGTVTVRVMTDDATADGIPSAGVVAAVQAAIDAARPVTAAALALAPVAQPLDLTIALTVDTVAVRDAVAAALADLVRTRTAPGQTLPLTWIHEAISTAAGEYDHVLSVPSADVTCAIGYLPTLGTITWA